MKLIKRNDMSWVELPGFSGLSHGILTRHGGVSDAPYNELNMSSHQGDDPISVLENQQRGYGVFGRTTAQLVHADLVHGNQVIRVDSSQHGMVIPACDGLVTNDKGCGLTMNYADCSSIFLYDPVNQAIGLGHAGWRGAVADLPGSLVDAMKSEFGSQPADIVAGLGPCISISHYEVDEPLISEVHRTFPKWIDRLLSYHVDELGEQTGKPHFNLALANHIRLYEKNVKAVALPTFCTASRTDLFFSHRAEQRQTGRFAAVIALN